MPDIRYVCLSDMHLGADSSVLTAIQQDGLHTAPMETHPVMRRFVECLQELLRHNEDMEKPQLVLNGDILEMALTDVNKAAMVFERFVELVLPPRGEPLFDKNIIYIPGNHDHHIWESARETQYVNHILKFAAGEEIPVPWHTTKMIRPDPVREYFLMLRSLKAITKEATVVAMVLGRSTPDPGIGAPIELSGRDASGLLNFISVGKALPSQGIASEEAPPALL